MEEFRLLIGGKMVAGDGTMDVVNPATEEILAVCPRASVAQLDQAVAAAKAAFPAWSTTPVEQRGKILSEIADVVMAHADELAMLLTQEQGKPLKVAMGEVKGTAAFFRYFSKLDIAVEILEQSEKRKVEAHRKPLGVVAAIVPWNFPLMILAFKLPVALLAGNTVVVKPAPTTPLTALRFAELVAGVVPAGVLNFITDANDLGGLLAEHPDVRKVSFTGSTATGRKVMSGAATTLKRLTLELGGNDAGIVLADVDVQATAPALFQAAFQNSGQVCLALKRLYVHESIYDEMCTELAKLADGAVVDDGVNQGAQFGPVQNRAQFERVKALIEEARADGAVVLGKEQVLDRPGFFIRPTVVRDIAEGSRLVNEEQFGPVLPVIKYSDVDDAVRRANASPYGLGASVWSSDLDRAYEVAKQLEAGSVWVNKHSDIAPSIPMGGAKQSGFGVEFGEEGLAEVTQLQIINRAP